MHLKDAKEARREVELAREEMRVRGRGVVGAGEGWSDSTSSNGSVEDVVVAAADVGDGAGEDRRGEHIGRTAGGRLPVNKAGEGFFYDDF